MRVVSLLVLFISVQVLGQFPEHVQILKVKPNTPFSVSGNLKDGQKIEDLSWASRSSTACFPATQNSKFRGNHMLYAFDIPPYSEITISVIPDDKNADLSLYGYQIGTSNYATVPDLRSCVSCEADHKWDRPKRGQAQNHTRTITFNAIRNPYNIVFGVTGNHELTEGKYSVQVYIKVAENSPTSSSAQKPLKVWSAKSEKGKVLSYKGNLNEGTPLPSLDWASRSSTACFPATQNKKFNGNHVIYSTTIPEHSIMTVTIIPKDKSKNFSVYGYQVGLSSDAMVPDLTSCVTCEADHKWDRPKRGKTQDHTRSITFNAINKAYKVVIGVTGAEGLDEGAFILKIEVQ